MTDLLEEIIKERESSESARIALLQREWYAVYPGVEKRGIGPKLAVAYCEVPAHAEILKKQFGPNGYVERTRPDSGIFTGHWYAVFCGSEKMDISSGPDGERPIALCSTELQAHQLLPLWGQVGFTMRLSFKQKE